MRDPTRQEIEDIYARQGSHMVDLFRAGCRAYGVSWMAPDVSPESYFDLIKPAEKTIKTIIFSATSPARHMLQIECCGFVIAKFKL